MTANWLTTLFPRSRPQVRKPSPPKRTRRRLGFEPLERRELMAADLHATLSLEGALRIEGTNLADTIEIRQEAGRIAVLGAYINSASGHTSSIDAASVKRIEVLGLGGNDVVDLSSSLLLTRPVFVDGGAGGDEILIKGAQAIAQRASLPAGPLFLARSTTGTLYARNALTQSLSQYDTGTATWVSSAPGQVKTLLRLSNGTLVAVDNGGGLWEQAPSASALQRLGGGASAIVANKSGALYMISIAGDVWYRAPGVSGGAYFSHLHSGMASIGLDGNDRLVMMDRSDRLWRQSAIGAPKESIGGANARVADHLIILTATDGTQWGRNSGSGFLQSLSQNASREMVLDAAGNAWALHLGSQQTTPLVGKYCRTVKLDGERSIALDTGGGLWLFEKGRLSLLASGVSTLLDGHNNSGIPLVSILRSGRFEQSVNGSPFTAIDLGGPVVSLVEVRDSDGRQVYLALGQDGVLSRIGPDGTTYLSGVQTILQGQNGAGVPVALLLRDGRFEQTTDGVLFTAIDLGGPVVSLAEVRDSDGRQVYLALGQNGVLSRVGPSGTTFLTGVTTLLQGRNGAGAPVALLLRGGRFEQTSDGVQFSVIDLGGSVVSLAEVRDSDGRPVYLALGQNGVLSRIAPNGTTYLTGVQTLLQSHDSAGRPVATVLRAGQLQQSFDGITYSIIGLGGPLASIANGRDTHGLEVLYALQHDGVLWRVDIQGAKTIASDVESFTVAGDQIQVTNRPAVLKDGTLTIRGTSTTEHIVVCTGGTWSFSGGGDWQVRDGRLHVSMNGREIFSAARGEVQRIVILAGDGDDMVIFRGDTWSELQVMIDAGAGNDLVQATTAGSCLIDGGAGNDDITSGQLADVIFGGDGNDRLVGSGGDDVLMGESGNDYLSGCHGNDWLFSGYDGFDELDLWRDGTDGDDTYVIEGAGTWAETYELRVVTRDNGQVVKVREDNKGTDRLLYNDGSLDTMDDDGFFAGVGRLFEQVGGLVGKAFDEMRKVVFGTDGDGTHSSSSSGPSANTGTESGGGVIRGAWGDNVGTISGSIGSNGGGVGSAIVILPPGFGSGNGNYTFPHILVGVQALWDRTFASVMSAAMSLGESLAIDLARKYLQNMGGSLSVAYFDRYLSGGDDVAMNLDKFLNEDPSIRAKVEASIREQRQSGLTSGRVVITQHDYAKQDYRNALGSTRFQWTLVKSENGQETIHIFMEDVYRWHPEDSNRTSQTFHKLMDRLKTKGAREFTTTGQTTIEISTTSHVEEIADQPVPITIKN